MASPTILLVNVEKKVITNKKQTQKACYILGSSWDVMHVFLSLFIDMWLWRYPVNGFVTVDK